LFSASLTVIVGNANGTGSSSLSGVLQNVHFGNVP
jgi:hypothetical protein